jgi:hypothetical protein
VQRRFERTRHPRLGIPRFPDGTRVELQHQEISQ